MKVRIYTDGACSENPGPGGWGMVVNSETKCKTYGGYSKKTTNNKMELKAVIEAYRFILDHKGLDDIEILSDSAYVVNSINQHWVLKWASNGWITTKGESVKNYHLWKQFLSLHSAVKQKGINVVLIQIKGHAVNTFNELADTEAKRQSEIARQKISEEETK